MNQNRSEDESRIVIQNQHLTGSSAILAQYGFSRIKISFVNCTFENVNRSGEVFGSCSFQNCMFKNFSTRKATFSGCSFEDCKITDSDMTRGDFYQTHFKNCEFVNVDLTASDIYSCTFKETRFLKSNLQLVGVDNVKVWKSNEWVKIKDCSSFEKHLDADRSNTGKALYLDLDFIDPTNEKYSHFYIKIPVGSEVLRRQNQPISLEEMAYNMGKKIIFQKHRFIGFKNGPARSEKVGHIVDLKYIPAHEKSIVKENILQGARDNGSDEGIMFLNAN